jgi:hypothetical protein
MRRTTIERRLSEAHQQLKRARAELAIVNEQLPVVDDAADDARLRALVSESPAGLKERDEASRQSSVMHKNRDALVERIAELERRQSELLDRLAVGPG